MEQVLLARAKNGDRKAFDQLSDSHRSRLTAFCLHFLLVETEAEDAVQETLVLAWKNLSTFHEASLFSTWLYRIARNQCLNRLRIRNTVISLDAIELDASSSGPGYAARVEDQLYTRQVVAAVMDQLNERDRIILWWHFQEQMTSEDISRCLPTEMKLSHDGVRSRLKRHIRPAIEAVRIRFLEPTWDESKDP